MCSLANFMQFVSMGHTTHIKVYIYTSCVRRIHKLCPNCKMERFEKVVNGFFFALNMPLESLK